MFRPHASLGNADREKKREAETNIEWLACIVLVRCIHRRLQSFDHHHFWKNWIDQCFAINLLLFNPIAHDTYI